MMHSTIRSTELLAVWIFSLSVLCEPQPDGLIVPFDSILPPCASFCGILYDIQGACSPPVTSTVNSTCFCADSRLQPIILGNENTCNNATVCNNTCDYAILRHWVLAYCGIPVAAQTVATVGSSASQAIAGLISSYIPSSVLSDLVSLVSASAIAASVTGNPQSLLFSAIEACARPAWFVYAIPSTYSSQLAALETNVQELYDKAASIPTTFTTTLTNGAATTVTNVEVIGGDSSKTSQFSSGTTSTKGLSSSSTSTAVTGSPTSGSNATVSHGHSGLSTGAKAGIGVGVSVAALAAILISFVLWKRRSKMTNHQSRWDKSELANTEKLRGPGHTAELDARDRMELEDTSRRVEAPGEPAAVEAGA